MDTPEEPQGKPTPAYSGNFCGYPGMVWYSRVRKVKGADLKVGDWLDTLDHRGARKIFGILAGPAPADQGVPDAEYLGNIHFRARNSNLLTVVVGGGETETIRADVEYDVVDPDSQVTPDGTPVTDR